MRSSLPVSWCLPVSERLNVLDAASFTVVTLTQRDHTPFHTVTKALILILAPASLVAVFGLGLRLVRQMGDKRHMECKSSMVKDRYIACAHGSLGRQVVLDLADMNPPMVVVDNRPQVLEIRRDIPIVRGDALDREVLQKVWEKSCWPKAR